MFQRVAKVVEVLVQSSASVHNKVSFIYLIMFRMPHVVLLAVCLLPVREITH